LIGPAANVTKNGDKKGENELKKHRVIEPLRTRAGTDLGLRNPELDWHRSDLEDQRWGAYHL